MEFLTHTVEQTLALGRSLGTAGARAGRVVCIALDGPLGAGKTHLTRGIAQGAAVEDPDLVSSPTYVLLNIYPGPVPVYHLDAYRITSPEDFDAIGFEELVADDAEARIVVVEWAEKIASLLPADHLRILIAHEGDAEDQRRTITLAPTGPNARGLIANILPPEGKR